MMKTKNVVMTKFDKFPNELVLRLWFPLKDLEIVIGIDELTFLIS